MRCHMIAGHDRAALAGASVVVGLVMLLGVSGCGGASQDAVGLDQNVVAAYLDGAERQAETEDQRLEIRRALNDMLEKDPEALRAERYADFGGTPNSWSVIELLQRHFVPREPVSLDPDAFYRDVSMPEAKIAIRTQLEALP